MKEDSWAFKDVMQAHKDGTLDTYASTCNILDERENSEDASSKRSVPRVFGRVEIQVVGCWDSDTVASLGVPWRPMSNAGGVTGQCKHFDGGLVKGSWSTCAWFSLHLTLIFQASNAPSMLCLWTSVGGHSLPHCGTSPRI